MIPYRNIKPFSISALVFVLLISLISAAPAPHGLRKAVYLHEPFLLPPTPDATGPYAIGSYELTYTVNGYGTFTATLKYPAVYDGDFSPAYKTSVRYPGVLINNGYLGTEKSISWIQDHLTGHGYITLAFTQPSTFFSSSTERAVGYIKGIDVLKSEARKASSPIFGLFDSSRIGAIGVSLGAMSAMEAAGTTDGISAVVAIAPPFEWHKPESQANKIARNISAPVQIQAGTDDYAVSSEKAFAYYTVLPDDTPKQKIELTRAGHVGFADDFWLTRLMKWAAGESNTLSFEKQQRISRTYFTSWFNYHLKDQPCYQTYILGDHIQQDYQENLISTLQHNLTPPSKPVPFPR